MQAPIFAEVYRNNILESVHRGHAVIMHANGDILFEAGDPTKIIFPRSSCKMLQALPLVESGAANQFRLTSEQIALSCASHNGEDMHVSRVCRWLSALDLKSDDLRCGPQAPAHWEDKITIHDADETHCRVHNNCSGKHCGFLTLNAHIGGNSEYHDIDHPVQKMIKTAMSEMTEEKIYGYGIDGCSAPNFTTTIKGFARALATMSRGENMGGSRGEASAAIVEAMMLHPEIGSGTKRADAAFMKAGKGKVATKTGAEAVFAAILPEHQIGVAIKIEDGTTRGAETAITALLVRLGVVDGNDPSILQYLRPTLYNFNNQEVGHIQAAETIWQGGKLF